MNEMTISYGETIWDPATYDAQRRRLVPSFDLLYGAVAELVADTGRADPAVLDLGAGTGLLSAAVRDAVPGARLHLFDGADPMLARARARLAPGAAGAAGAALPVVTTVADLTGPLPAGPFDAVVSALAIHHLDDPAKRNLFRRVHAVVEPGGVFVNLEQVNGPDDTLTRRYADIHERRARTAGADDDEWNAALSRMAHDRCAPLEAQLAWLREAGFHQVDCVVKDWRFAVYAGWRPTQN
nr:class I SAM-dependent methyltransferase [Frankia sp. Cppng1_Ct_nod]